MGIRPVVCALTIGWLLRVAATDEVTSIEATSADSPSLEPPQAFPPLLDDTAQATSTDEVTSGESVSTDSPSLASPLTDSPSANDAAKAADKTDEITSVESHSADSPSPSQSASPPSRDAAEATSADEVSPVEPTAADSPSPAATSSSADSLPANDTLEVAVSDENVPAESSSVDSVSVTSAQTVSPPANEALPSTEVEKTANVEVHVEHPATLAEDVDKARRRRSCDEVIHAFINATAHQGIVGRIWLDAFKSLAYTSQFPLHKDSDKDAVDAINTLNAALAYSENLDFEILGALAECDVDGTGKTILQKLIQRGFIKTISSRTTWNLLAPFDATELLHLVDANGDNILHLAVASRASDMVNQVIYSLERELTSDQLKLFFDGTNNGGLRPVDIARSPSWPPDVLTTLNKFYRTHYYGQGALRRIRPAVL